MRIHRTHAYLAPWSIGAPVLDAACLSVVRVEPVLVRRRGLLALDFVLADGPRLTVVPLALADPTLLLSRERDPIVFPDGTPAGDRFAAALAEQILPHLAHLILAAEPIVEHVVELAPSDAFTAAREAGCFGAAPLRESLVRLAPYRYARRFARGRLVRIDAPDAAGGAAILRDVARAVAMGPERRDDAAERWYGEASECDGVADVAVLAPDAAERGEPCILRLDSDTECRIDVVDPLPLDVAITFDPGAGPTRRWFSVERALEPVVRPCVGAAHAPRGGSAGAIRVILGRGAAAPAADTDEAVELAGALATEGFDARVVSEPAELAGADLIHLIGVRDGTRAHAIVAAARAAGIPVVVHAHEGRVRPETFGAAVAARACFDDARDERELSAALAALARDHGSATPASANSAPSDAGRALQDAALVFAASVAESDALRAAGRRGPIAIVPPLAAPIVPAAVGALTGPDPYIFAHAPIGPLANLLAVARAATDARLPLVVAGPVVDARYLERLTEFGGSRLVVLPGEPSPAEAAALRAAAAVVVDAAWCAEGGSRLAAAALAGARLALSALRAFDVPGVTVRRFDPADAGAIAGALTEAWDEALRLPGRGGRETRVALAPSVVVRAILRGYAEAAAARA